MDDLQIYVLGLYVYVLGPYVYISNNTDVYILREVVTDCVLYLQSM